MSGPALRQTDSHSSIHEAAIGEAEQLTELLRFFLEQGESEKAYETACIALEHWETRTLMHANEEEEGLYKDIVKADPFQREKIATLTRDHVLMRRLAEEIRTMLAAGHVSRSALIHFEAMILIDLLHNRDEELLVASLGGVR